MAREDTGRRQEDAIRLIAGARVKTGDFIARLMMAYTGFATFCIFSLLSPERLIIEAKASLNMPFAGAVSYLAFMLVAPVMLIGMRVYLEVYVHHWRQLDAELDSETEPKAVSPLKHPLLRIFSAAVLYPLLPATLALFTWKAAAKGDWGDAFLLLTLVCAVTQAFGFKQRPLFIGTAHIALLYGQFIAVVTGLLFAVGLSAGGIPHRYLDLAREDLNAAYLVGVDLRNAVLDQSSFAGADLSNADLTDADLTDTNLTDAYLWFANLTGANLTDANLWDANLTDADLTGALGLTQSQLDVACAYDAEYPQVNLPDGLEWRGGLCTLN